ncbi:bifunctional DNA primase/polymerase [Streptomyces sp. DSM 44915]|uniref:Bifunctional DNA primase/polymerase n=1 Tax=Streptomyces chisholmiae TaxID=3075540 RepID=A0ABU2JWI5_9ACTN|nr:bifunctional DNA primase/polymerase [Streptomyces sp. DSM 44915]MDT0269350.1 bifunctional DNA primase/polymerase [Streptomyces sp. DSM 44915]
MGFTIGGMRERGAPRPMAGRARRGAGRSRGDTAVAEYVGLWGWDVTPGAAARPGAAGRRAGCSCGRPDCPAPGAHPQARAIPAGTPLDEALDAWAEARSATPGATVLLPTGRAFDVLQVPAVVARAALPRLERLALPLGPVAQAPDGRAWFFVAPGFAAELPTLLDELGWGGLPLRLTGLGRGSHVTAPPSSVAGLGEVVWLRPPDLETAAAPPSAKPLLGALASLCHRLTPAD